MAAVCANRQVTPAARLSVIKTILDKWLRYICSKATWPLHDNNYLYEALDKTEAETTTTNMQSFPSKLLWIHREHGGLDIPCITQSAQLDKTANICQSRAATTDCLLRQVVDGAGQYTASPFTLTDSKL